MVLSFFFNLRFCIAYSSREIFWEQFFTFFFNKFFTIINQTVKANKNKNNNGDFTMKFYSNLDPVVQSSPCRGAFYQQNWGYPVHLRYQSHQPNHIDTHSIPNEIEIIRALCAELRFSIFLFIFPSFWFDSFRLVIYVLWDSQIIIFFWLWDVSINADLNRTHNRWWWKKNEHINETKWRLIEFENKQWVTILIWIER